MKKGECFHCPCHYVDTADNDRCGIDRAMTFSVVDEVDCPLEEFKERRKPMKVYGHRLR